MSNKALIQMVIVYTLLLIGSISFAKEKSRTYFTYGALAAHAWTQDNSVKANQLMPNRIDNAGHFVRLPTYFALSREYVEDKSVYLDSFAIFQNCYLDWSLAFQHGFRAEDLSTKRLSTYLAINLYARERPLGVLPDGTVDYISEIPLEIKSGRYGFNIFPSLTFTYQINRYMRLDASLSGVSVFQISWRIK